MKSDTENRSPVKPTATSPSRLSPKSSAVKRSPVKQAPAGDSADTAVTERRRDRERRQREEEKEGVRWEIIFFFQAEDGIRDDLVTGVQTCALPISQREMGSIKSGGAAAARIDKYKKRGRCRYENRAV